MAAEIMGRWNRETEGTRCAECAYKYSETKARGKHSKVKKPGEESACRPRAQLKGLSWGRQYSHGD